VILLYILQLIGSVTFLKNLKSECMTKVFTERIDVLKMTGATGDRRFAFCNGWH
jgi:hypothetical protein